MNARLLPLTLSAAILAWIPDFLIGSILLFVIMAIFGFVPPTTAALLPVVMVAAIVAAFSVGVWLSALNVAYRDVQYVVPFLAQAWLFATPAVYVGNTFASPWNVLLGLNPMQGVVAGMRWALLRSSPPPGGMLAVSVAVALFALVSGAVAFRHFERRFADVV